MEKLLGLPEIASAHGGQIDHVIGLVHWLMAIMFVGWGILFLYMLWRFRKSRQPRADYHGLQTKAPKVAESAVVVSELVLLFLFSIPLWSDRVDDFPDESEATVVRVVGEQFAWNSHYPGADGTFGRTSPEMVDIQSNPLGIDRSDPAAKDDVWAVNQLYLPVNRPAIIHVTSKDVIHSLMLNEMRSKQDAIPGISVPMWFTPTVTTAEMRERTGNPEFDYEVACAQLCGIGHYRMRGFMTIQTQPEFDAWLAAEVEAAQSSDEDDFWN